VTVVRPRRNGDAPDAINWGWGWTQLLDIIIDGTSPSFPTEPTYVDLVSHNFSGATYGKKLYGASGVGKAFSFDGTVLSEITTGMATDAPNRIAVHKNRLFLSFGSSLQFSAAADPTAWTPVLGAGEVSMGDPISQMGSIGGNDAASALLVGTNASLAVLYGDTSSDFKLVPVNTEMGMYSNTLQIMSSPLFMNDFGVTPLAASDTYGNFAMGAISQRAQKFITARRRRATCSVLARSKNQYRIFFDDGSGLYFTFMDGKLSAITPMKFDRVVRRAMSTFLPDGSELVLFSSDDENVYRMDVGRNFDGVAIDAFFAASFNHMGGPRSRLPRVRKAFKRVVLEVESDRGYVAFQAGANVDHSGPDAQQSLEQDVVMPKSSTWDEIVWDEFVWDATGKQPATVPVDGTGKNLSLFVRSTDRLVDSFTVTGVMTHWVERRQER
jgi:hypothetical protein